MNIKENLSDIIRNCVKQVQNICKSYKVNVVAIGAYCNWRSCGALQWSRPRRIVHIAEKDGYTFVFCDGSSTGIPLEQIELE
tara:strand:- start:5809 stop:6054 length:246 start_codon:yes stop_codon:yes gene_type:complete